MAPDDSVEDVADVLARLERPEHRVDRVRADLMAPLHKLDELVDHRARLRDMLLVTVQGQLVPAQANRAVETLLERVEDAVRDPGELGGDGVRDIECFDHLCQV